MIRPYIHIRESPRSILVENPDNAMHVVWHHDIRVEGGVWEMVRDIQPATVRYPSSLVKHHFAVNHLPEKRKEAAFRACKW